MFFFFFGHAARPRRFGEKKVTRNIEKKAHGLKEKKKKRCVCVCVCVRMKKSARRMAKNTGDKKSKQKRNPLSCVCVCAVRSVA